MYMLFLYTIVLSEFQTWKNDFELNEMCSFTKMTSGYVRNDGQKLLYYRCNRTGKYKPKRTKTRRKKGNGNRN